METDLFDLSERLAYASYWKGLCVAPELCEEITSKLNQ